jgi:uncharacterized membrane protein YdjX (TVP38/TMEM64 family)
MANNEEPVAHKRIITALEIILISLAFYGAYRYTSSELAQIKTFIVNSGPYGILLSMVFLGMLGATPIPAEPFTILLSTIYGPFWAMIATAVGTLFSALVDSPAFLIGARVIPGYGSKFVSLISGLYRVPLLRFIWTTFIATLLGAAITAYGGYKLVTLLAQLL